MCILEEWSNAATVIVAVEAENKRLRAQRDQLLAALKDTLGALDAEFGQQVVDINFKLLRAAIAAVER